MEVEERLEILKMHATEARRKRTLELEEAKLQNEVYKYMISKFMYNFSLKNG